jgi:hypothetical protein
MSECQRLAMFQYFSLSDFQLLIGNPAIDPASFRAAVKELCDDHKTL